MNDKENIEPHDAEHPATDKLKVALSLVGDTYVSDSEEQAPELSKDEMDELLARAGKREGNETSGNKDVVVAFWPNAITLAAAAMLVFAFVKYHESEDPSEGTPTRTKPILVAPHLPEETPENTGNPSTPPADGSSRLQSGLNFLEQGDHHLALEEYEEAIKNFEQALAKEMKANGPWGPDAALIYGRLGKTYKARGEYEKATQLFEKSLAIFLKYHDR